VRLAIQEDLRSRSAFKLSEIQQTHQIIKPNDVVIDLGAAPGGWSCIVSKILNKNGLLISVDLLTLEPINGAVILQGDFTALSTHSLINRYLDGKRPTVVLSDMLMNTSGHKDMDHFRSINLSNSALDFAERFQSDVFLCKILRGSDEKEFINNVSSIFTTVKTVKPKASRLESSEVFILGRGKRLTPRLHDTPARI